MGVERLLISIPKCIELNSELILVFGLGSHQGPRPSGDPRSKFLRAQNF